jgi:hypothetical protein
MKISELKVGDILEIDPTIGRDIKWAVDESRMKVRLFESPRKASLSSFGWSAQLIKIKNAKIKGYSKGSTSIPKFETQMIPGIEYTYNVLEIVYPFSFNFTTCTASPAVYLGVEVDPFESFGVKKHHRMLVDGKVCLFPGRDVRFLRKVVARDTQE